MPARHTEISEDDLIALRSNDARAFERVYRAHIGLVIFTCTKLGVAPDVADEVAQECFVRLHHHAGRLTSISGLKAWLVTTTRNLVMDHYRASKKHQDDIDTDTLVDHTNAMASAERALELDLVGELLDEVGSEPGSETLIEFYRAGMSVKEIADKNAESTSAVTSRLTRLRRKLAERLRQRYGIGTKNE